MFAVYGQEKDGRSIQSYLRSAYPNAHKRLTPIKKIIVQKNKNLNKSGTELSVPLLLWILHLRRVSLMSYRLKAQYVTNILDLHGVYLLGRKPLDKENNHNYHQKYKCPNMRKIQ